MAVSASAARYARALLDVAIAESDPDQIERDLERVAATISEHAELQQALTTGAVPPSSRAAILQSVAAVLGVAPPVGRVLALLAQRGRVRLLPDIAVAYHDRLLAHKNIVLAEVTAAAQLPPETVSALAAGLSHTTGKRVQVHVEVDPDLIGGLVARVGSKVYDGSVRTQLQKMKREIVEQG
jgi:F-type H+-transporting ATPase subunit delta